MTCRAGLRPTGHSHGTGLHVGCTMHRGVWTVFGVAARFQYLDTARRRVGLQYIMELFEGSVVLEALAFGGDIQTLRVRIIRVVGLDPPGCSFAKAHMIFDDHDDISSI